MEYNNVKKVFFYEFDRNVPFSEYDCSYLFTTENIKGYMPNLTDKDVLTVCSSGDHYLNALLMGANNIDLFDINRLTLMTLKLKITAIKNIDLNYYLDYFGVYNKSKVLDYKIFCMFSKYLDADAYAYFNMLYKMCNYSGNYLYNATGMFYMDRSEPFTYFRSNAYLDESNYFYLRNLLFNKPFDSQFICSDINSVGAKVSKKYDSVFLSNIQDYQDEKSYLQIVCGLKNVLNDNGCIYFAYLYHNTRLYNNSVYNDFVSNNPECFSIPVESIYADRERPNIKDKVLVYGKFC